MAYSSLSEDAQAIKLCDLCQEDNIKWRCIECDMCLCGKCKTFHLRVPATAQHQIITITTPLEDVQRKIFTNNIPCKDHETKVMSLFCRTCGCLVCADCVSMNHPKHHFISIEMALGEKLDKTKSLKTKINDSFTLCESTSEEVKNIKPKYNAVFDDSETKIRRREQELKDTISKYSLLLLNKVEDQRSKVNKTFSKIDQEIDDTKQELNIQSHKVETLLSSNQGQVIFEEDIKVPVLEFDHLPKVIAHFVHGVETPKKLQELFGSLRRTTIQDLEFKVLQSFSTDLVCIDSMKILDQKSICISDFSTKIIQMANIKEKSFKVSKEISFQALDMALVPSGDIILTNTSFFDSGVKILTKSGDIKPFLSVDPLSPVGVHVTENKNVIVGVREDFSDPFQSRSQVDLFKLTPKSQRAIFIFGMDGKKKHVYEYDKGKKRLFTLPIRIRTNYNQDILVVDRSAQIAGRVVALGKNGDLSWVYTGHSQTNAKTTFNPQDIVTTSIGDIIVSDSNSYALHVLSEHGDLLMCKIIYQMGIQYPVALDIDKIGQLWVGSYSGNDAKKCKLHIVKLLW